ncbi:DUF4440 domain-containing protein [Aurantibacter crassamenti]|nr:DUF4440 domain-containing protein [Aurantibacter crassamenti]
MKIRLLFITISLITFSTITAQENEISHQQNEEITKLIANYSTARETKDAVLLKSILTDDIDQLVSSGVWRKGIAIALEGMQNSTKVNPGARTLTIDTIRHLNSESAIVDAKYQIENTDGSIRKMWSTFIVVKSKDLWKIAAIRNMLPAKP